MKGRRLTEKQRDFVRVYVAMWPWLNAACAAREAGYSQRNSDVAAAKQKRKRRVRRSIERGIAGRRKRFEDAERLRDEEFAKASRCHALRAAGHTLEEAMRISGYEPAGGADERKSLAQKQAMIARAMSALNPGEDDD